MKNLLFSETTGTITGDNDLITFVHDLFESDTAVAPDFVSLEITTATEGAGPGGVVAGQPEWAEITRNADIVRWRVRGMRATDTINYRAKAWRLHSMQRATSPVKQTGADMVGAIGSAVVTSAAATFQTNLVRAGDRLAIIEAQHASSGAYSVLTVDSEIQLTLTANLPANLAAGDYAVGPGAYVSESAAGINQVQFDLPAGTAHTAIAPATDAELPGPAIETGEIAAGALSADAAGRAIMTAGYFNAGNVISLAQFDDLFVTTAKIDNLAVTTGKVVDGAVSDVKLGPDRGQTYGFSASGRAAPTDISALPDNQFGIAVDGGAASQVILVNAGQNTGNLVAAEMQSKIQALGGAFVGVLVSYTAAQSRYLILSGTRGSASSVVISNGLANNIADELFIGAANGGFEATGGSNLDEAVNRVAGGALLPLSVETAAMNDLAVTTGKINASAVTTGKIALGEAAAASTYGAQMHFVHAVPAQVGVADVNLDAASFAYRIADAWIVWQGAAGSTQQLRTVAGAAAITDAMSSAGGADSVARAAQVLNANAAVAAAAVLVMRSGGVCPAAQVHVVGVKA